MEAEKKKEQDDVKPVSLMMDTETEAENLNPLELLKREYENKKNQLEA